ncbi:MAG: alpha-ketoacid dehydrogenase subunit beta [Anaerolineales bacterium]|jgi:pyruvate/2-oxoglutarate/acetoin dehydrogenase E1 component
MTTVLESLNQALHRALQEDETVFILGEDILDPYGGAFKVSQGLSTSYPGRVFTTPVSESGIIGLATGMALRGLHPIAEIMFGDFTTLIADQVINHAAKFRYMYNDQVRVPIVIRTPMGGRRGYGPTHSQTLEKLFLGTPGISILSPNIFIDPGDLLLHAIFDLEDPVLFVENKVQYSQRIMRDEHLKEFNLTKIDNISDETSNWKIKTGSPAIKLALRDAPPASVTIATYGYMADLCRQAALRLAYENEIFIDLIVFSQLLPVNLQPIIDSLQKSQRLIVVEEGTRTSGWGAELLASCIEEISDYLQQAGRVASLDAPIPVSKPLENDFLPGVDDIMNAVKKMV